jgi:hypothetical protein
LVDTTGNGNVAPAIEPDSTEKLLVRYVASWPKHNGEHRQPPLNGRIFQTTIRAAKFCCAVPALSLSRPCVTGLKTATSSMSDRWACAISQHALQP